MGSERTDFMTFIMNHPFQELPASCRSFAGEDEGNRTLVSSDCNMRGPTSRSPSFKLLICLWSHNARFQRIKAELRQRRLKRTPKFRRQNLIQVVEGSEPATL